MEYKKVLLVNPSQKSVYEKIGRLSLPHMGLSYIGAILEKQGCEVRLIDMDYDNVTAGQAGRLVKNENFSLVGLTATTPVIKNALMVAKSVKSFSPDTKVVIGGVHPTVMSQEVIRDPAVDFVVRGEGENTVKELLEAINGKRDLKNILGITYRENGAVIENERRPLIENLDEVVLPARNLFKVEQYNYPNMLYRPAAPMHTSRGCPGNCTFCQAKSMYGRRVRFRSAKSVVDEVEFLIKTYGIRQIDVWDDNFSVNKLRVFQIRDEIKRRNIKTNFSFNAGIRVDSACDEEVLKAMREMGGYNIAFGVESGSQEILDEVQKGTTLEQARRAVSLAKKIGFETWAFFILGFPYDSEETMEKTIDFAKELNPDIAHFHILKPYPGSQIYEEIKQNNLIDNFDYADYGMYSFPVHHTSFVSRAKIFEYQKLAYRSFYLQPRVMLNQIKSLRSMNRFMGNLKTGKGILRFMLDGNSN